MQILFLGTGASEGIPGVLCECPLCEAAREHGGRNIRRRSSVLIDGQLLIDLTPDFWSQAVAFHVKPGLLQTILITHEHDEHFVPAELQNFVPPYRLSDEPTRLELYAGQRSLRKLSHMMDTQGRTALRGFIGIHELKPFRTVKTGAYTITPLPARHCEGAMIFLIEREGRVFLNGNDSGYFPEDTWDYLAGKTIHSVSLGCTNPSATESPNHQSEEDVVTTRRRLYQLGCIESSAKIYITHISHTGGMGHDELHERMSTYGVTVAYDGLTSEV